MLLKLKLVELHLPKNHIGQEGALHLARYLKKSDDGLRVLDLFSNNIQDEGAAAIIEALGNFPRLQGFNLGQNDLSYKIVEPLCKLLAESTTELEFVKFGHNYIGRTIREVLELLSENKHIKSVDISYNAEANRLCLLSSSSLAPQTTA